MKYPNSRVVQSNQELPIVAILREHWKVTGIIAMTTFLLAAIIIALLPKRYESRMVLLVKHERQALVVSPDNNANQAQPGEFNETEVNSEVALLESEDVLKDVVLRRGLAVVPPDTVKAYDGRPSPLSIEKATSLLRHNLNISPIKKSDVIDVSYSALSPESAAGVLHQLADTVSECPPECSRYARYVFVFSGANGCL